MRVIGADGEQVGVLKVEEARALARKQSLDLVEIAPKARPPVCRILDYGRFLFEREKKEKMAKQHQHRIATEEVKLRPNIGEHDFQTKVGRAKRFLDRGYHVKLTIMFRYRELRRPENGYDLLRKVTEDLTDTAVVEIPPPETLSGRDLSMVYKPAS